jgi:hypothetical protein
VGRGKGIKINRKQKERQKYKEKTNCTFDLCITASPLPTCLPENMVVQLKDGLHLHFPVKLLILSYVFLQIRKTNCIFAYEIFGTYKHH